MTKEPIMIDCEYCIVRGNENKCKALQTETHTCLGITAKNKCPIYKLKQQLKHFDNEYEGFAVKYTDMEIALKRKEQECEEWKNKYYGSTTEVKADLIKQVDQLKKENEQLKKSVRSNKDKRKRAVERYLKLKKFTNKEFEKLKRKEQECENYCFTCDVAERMRKVTYAATGGRLSYGNYTVEAIEQAYQDQLNHQVEVKTEELTKELDELKEKDKEKTEFYKKNLIAIRSRLYSIKDDAITHLLIKTSCEGLIDGINEVLNEVQAEIL